MNKKKLGVFYWHNPTRIGNLYLVNDLRNDFEITIISNQDVPYLNRFGEFVLAVDYQSPDLVIKALASHQKKHGLDGLITLSEGAVTLMADAAKVLNLRGNSPEGTRLGRNKFLMREALHKEEIPIPAYAKAHNLNEAINVFKKTLGSKSFFLKPPCIGGSSFCTVIENESELRDCWEEFFEGSKTRTKGDPLFVEQFGQSGEHYYMLLEELMGGTHFDYDDIIGTRYPVFELSVEGFIDGNETYVYSMTDKLLPIDCKNGEEYMWRMHSRIPAELKEILKKRVSKINNIFGATMGCSHTEFRVEECDKVSSDIIFKRKYYRARLIESALRPGGAFMQSAIYTATGFNSIRAMAYQACGEDSQEKVRYRYPIIMANLWSKEAGKLVEIKNLDKILSLKDKLLDFHLYDSIGQEVEIPPIASRGMADAVLQGSTVNLEKIKNWEILSGEESPYRKTEELYLKVVELFEPKVK